MRLTDDFAALAAAVSRVGKALVVFWREVYRAEESALEEMRVVAKLPSQRLLAEVTMREVDAVLQRLHRLSVLCDVQALDFSQMTDLAIDIHAGGEQSWAESLDMAIENAERANEAMLDAMRTATRDPANEPDTKPEALDAPNDRLPSLFVRSADRRRASRQTALSPRGDATKH